MTKKEKAISEEDEEKLKALHQWANQPETEEDGIRAEAIKRLKIKKMLEKAIKKHTKLQE